MCSFLAVGPSADIDECSGMMSSIFSRIVSFLYSSSSWLSGREGGLHKGPLGAKGSVGRDVGGDVVYVDIHVAMKGDGAHGTATENRETLVDGSGGGDLKNLAIVYHSIISVV